MKKVVFLLGAGFARHAGGPLIDDFLSTARDYYSNQPHQLEEYEKEIFKKVFDYQNALGSAQSKINCDIENIEELFSLLDMNCAYSSDQGILDTRQALIHLIIKTLDIAISQDQSLYSNFLSKLYERKYGVGPRFDFSFISFNYDILLEKALQRSNANFDYCTYVTSYENILLKSQGREHENTKLLKLHGSANWWLCKSCDKLEFLHHKNVGRNFNAGCPQCRKPWHPLLIPPTWNKILDSNYMRNVWASAFEELKAATELVIIGYSLPHTDVYFRHLLALSLKDNISLRKILVVDPSQSTHDKFKQLFNENFYRRHCEGIVSGFEQSMPNVLHYIS